MKIDKPTTPQSAFKQFLSQTIVNIIISAIIYYLLIKVINYTTNLISIASRR